jgi:hypothetical protein
LFNVTAAGRLQRLRDKTQWVEEEVEWAKYQKQQAQHSEVLRLLQGSQSSAMALQLPYRDLPFSRNHSFHHREHLLSRLEDALSPGTASLTLKSVGLHGLGGIGKTQLAAEYAYRHTDAYDAIFWLKAETEARLRESVCAYAGAMQQNAQRSPQQDAAQVSIFKKWLMTAATITIQGKSQFMP